MKAPIYVDDTGSITMMELRSKARRLKSREPQLGLIVVDYLQLMSTGASVENRVQEVSQISRQLKVLARDLDVPILALSQLSRAVEQRHDKRPILSDLRESGSPSRTQISSSSSTAMSTTTARSPSSRASPSSTSPSTETDPQGWSNSRSSVAMPSSLISPSPETVEAPGPLPTGVQPPASPRAPLPRPGRGGAALILAASRGSAYCGSPTRKPLELPRSPEFACANPGRETLKRAAAQRSASASRPSARRASPARPAPRRYSPSTPRSG